jgi:hypothetical protein
MICDPEKETESEGEVFVDWALAQLAVLPPQSG